MQNYQSPATAWCGILSDSFSNFGELLASRRIPPHYDVADLDEDVDTLREQHRGRPTHSAQVPARPVAGNLTTEDIAAARREMWSDFPRRDI